MKIKHMLRVQRAKKSRLLVGGLKKGGAVKSKELNGF